VVEVAADALLEQVVAYRRPDLDWDTPTDAYDREQRSA
jgi:hypothetical protein